MTAAMDEPAHRPVPGRRARIRKATLRELSAASLAEIREHGAADLSLRRVARRMGMSPAGLYRYVDSREALLTRLIAEAYDDLADHLHAAVGIEAGPAPGQGRRADHPVRPGPARWHVTGEDDDVVDRVRAAALTYRRWAVEHPNEFGLVFGDPIPGYAAPAGGVTVDAMRRVGVGLTAPLVAAWEAGRLRTRPLEGPGHGFGDQLGPMAEVAGPDAPPELSLTLLTTWGRLHGQVSLEAFGHHDWLFPEGCEELFRADLEALLDELGITGG